ncbi:Chemotaxis response regulator protein-glutamate methylesterase [Hyella patelloides LEGE 07179]|uniref:Protein-glutamate methylesterase/protein-glutamine glutaminase n=1 Tax=Hyella patelloides LEGE 07179 TaxID=945734 RepID=A0A563VKV5_9CYAN|nr:chemotaxis-specific protein-glutamate methyltransferase CheB [Hyella patelloides]VEP12069.1 Chemotaxis response regulator protein-glutamate methylesterase [Hyella patelloides LEGE 07179]
MKVPIKVFLVEDSPVALTILQRILASSPEIEIVGTASDGISALKHIPRLKPDVVCTDLLMGKMDGLELTKKLMAEFPKPILVISDVVTANDTQKIGQLLDAGIVDVFPKPTTGFIQDYEQQKNDLIYKIKIISGVKVFTKRNYERNHINNNRKTDTSQRLLRRTTTEPALTVGQNTNYKPLINQKITNYQIVAIGVSTGGPKAMQQIVSKLPANFPLPIVCTQHISTGFLKSLISWLSLETKLKIKIAELGEKPLPGIVYYAPEQYHLEIDNKGRFAYSQAPPIDSHCPSVNIMMQSLAQFYGKSTIGILLTGMGKDGVTGMQDIYHSGGLTIAQDEASSIIFGMPQEAIKSGIVQQVLPLKDIAPFLIRQVGY